MSTMLLVCRKVLSCVIGAKDGVKYMFLKLRLQIKSLAELYAYYIIILFGRMLSYYLGYCCQQRR